MLEKCHAFLGTEVGLVAFKLEQQPDVGGAVIFFGFEVMAWCKFVYLHRKGKFAVLYFFVKVLVFGVGQLPHGLVVRLFVVNGNVCRQQCAVSALLVFCKFAFQPLYYVGAAARHGGNGVAFIPVGKLAQSRPKMLVVQLVARSPQQPAEGKVQLVRADIVVAVRIAVGYVCGGNIALYKFLPVFLILGKQSRQKAGGSGVSLLDSYFQNPFKTVVPYAENSFDLCVVKIVKVPFNRFGKIFAYKRGAVGYNVKHVRLVFRIKRLKLIYQSFPVGGYCAVTLCF